MPTKDAVQGARAERELQRREESGRERSSRIRSGPRVSPEAEEEFQQRRLSYAVLCTNSNLSKILRDGKVEIIPTSELYAKSPDEREGIEVDDPTVTGPLGIKPNIFDRAEFEFNMSERGDSISAQHATGAAGPIGREAPPPLRLNAGSFGEEQEAQKEQRSAAKSAKKSTVEDEDTDTDGEEFDPSNPRATPISELEAALEEASDAEVKKAQKNDDRAGAQKIYERRLSGE